MIRPIATGADRAEKLTDERLEELDEQGFIIVPDYIEGGELKRLQEAQRRALPTWEEIKDNPPQDQDGYSRGATATTSRRSCPAPTLRARALAQPVQGCRRLGTVGNGLAAQVRTGLLAIWLLVFASADQTQRHMNNPTNH